MRLLRQRLVQLTDQVRVRNWMAELHGSHITEQRSDKNRFQLLHEAH